MTTASSSSKDVSASMEGKHSHETRKREGQSSVFWKKRNLCYLLGLAGVFRLVLLNKESISVRPTLDDRRNKNDGFSVEDSAPVAVVYTGPTSVNTEEGKNWLYLKNFDYFLDHGIECIAHDTIIVVTRSVAKYYEARIRGIQERCNALRERQETQATGKLFASPALRVLEREDWCYDMESLRVVFEKVDLSSYDSLVYLNCDVVGPKLPEPTTNTTVTHPHHLPWTYRYTSLLSTAVKMSGLSITSFRVHPHVENMLFAVDRVGLEILQNFSATYGCAEFNTSSKRNDILGYEIGMSRAILGAGYSIRSTHGPYGSVEIRPQDVGMDLQWCRDIWFARSFPMTPYSKWEDFMFFKSSRMFLLPGMEEEIRYNRTMSFKIVHGEPQETHHKSYEDAKREGMHGQEERRDKATICMVVKNEEAYLDEFVDYHHALGFEKVFLYDNTESFEMKQWAERKGTFIEAKHWPGEAQQLIVYNDCAKEARQQNFTWAAFFDADEILILKQHNHVVDCLKQYCDPGGAVGINWVYFGTAGQEVYSPQPFTKRFQYRTAEYPNQHIKTIASLSHFERMGANPHVVVLGEGHVTRDTSRREIYGPFNDNGPTDVALLYHYSSKSYKEYIHKRMRGIAADAGTQTAWIESAQRREVPRGEVFDDSGWIAMKRYVPEYAWFD